MNALPQLAAATVNCRVVPEDSVEYVRSVLRKIVADDQVNIKGSGEVSKGPASPMRPDVFKAVSRITDTLWPGVPTIPTMIMAAPDAMSLRPAGIPTHTVQGFFIALNATHF